MSGTLDGLSVEHPASLSSFPPPLYSSSSVAFRTLPISVPKVMTTVKTLRRVCGFVLALVGFIFYCLRSCVAFWSLVSFFLMAQSLMSGPEFAFLAVETGICCVGLCQFWWIVSKPTFTLKDSNFRNVCPLALIPILAYCKWAFFASGRGYLFVALGETLFYSLYIYALSLNGQSNSMWAGLKPYRYEVIPLMLSIQPSSRAFPQYTIPTGAVYNKFQ